MVDSVRLARKRQADSLNNANRAISDRLLGAVTRYYNAIQQGDLPRAREAYPNMSERDQQYWLSNLERYDLRIIVEPPRNIILSGPDKTVADVELVLRVRYTDKSTKSSTTSPPLRRQATLSKQAPTRWQLTSLSGP